mgnify:CR=1 FL=1
MCWNPNGKLDLEEASYSVQGPMLSVRNVWFTAVKRNRQRE